MRAYLQDLLHHLPLHNPSWKFKLFSPEWATPFELKAGSDIDVVICPNVPVNRIRRAIYEQTRLPRLIRDHKVDLWLGTNNTLPLKAKCKRIVIAQAFQFFTQPDVYPFVQRTYLRTIVPLSYRCADAVIALSQTSKDEIVRRLRLPQERLVVIPHALPGPMRSASMNTSGDDEVVLRVTGSTAPFIFCISALYPYKNHRRLVEAFAKIRSEFPRHRLVIAGADTFGLTREALRGLAAGLGVERNVLLVGRVAGEDLPSLYRTAEAMAMPSLDETFGLTVLEAMHMGCPVVTSQASAMSETGGDAVILVDPLSVESIAEGLRKVLGSPEIRAGLSERSRKRAALYTTERMIRQLSQAVDSVASFAR